MTGERPVTVGMLDTGVDVRTVPIDRWLFVDREGRLVSDDRPRDSEGHGTAMAVEIRRRAPDTRLFVAAVIHGGDQIVRMLRGLEWMIEQEVDIICLAWGLRQPNPVLDRSMIEMRRRGMLVIAAAGNDGEGSVRDPARHPAVLAVGACDEGGRARRESGSIFKPSVGVHKPDVIAASERGTSGACAAVTGMAASLLTRSRDCSAFDIEAALKATARSVDPDQRHRSRAGLVDVDAAHAWLRAGGRSGTDATISARRYRDPRLLRQISQAQPHEIVRAVLVHEATRVVSLPAFELSTFIDDTDPLVASAVDVDLWNPRVALSGMPSEASRSQSVHAEPSLARRMGAGSAFRGPDG